MLIAANVCPAIYLRPPIKLIKTLGLFIPFYVECAAVAKLRRHIQP